MTPLPIMSCGSGTSFPTTAAGDRRFPFFLIIISLQGTTSSVSLPLAICHETTKGDNLDRVTLRATSYRNQRGTEGTQKLHTMSRRLFCLHGTTYANPSRPKGAKGKSKSNEHGYIMIYTNFSYFNYLF